jgi:hypothetical protein
MPGGDNVTGHVAFLAVGMKGVQQRRTPICGRQTHGLFVAGVLECAGAPALYKEWSDKERRLNVHIIPGKPQCETLSWRRDTGIDIHGFAGHKQRDRVRLNFYLQVASEVYDKIT